MRHCNIRMVRPTRIDLGQRNIAAGQIPHQFVDTARYLRSGPKCRRSSEMRRDDSRNRVHFGSIDQDKPVAGAGIGYRRVIGDRPRQRLIALDQMHGDDSVEFFLIELLPQCGAKCVLAPGHRPHADDAEHRTAALSAADGDSRDRADHVPETRESSLRPVGGIVQRLAIGRTVEDVERVRRIQTEVFRVAGMRDVTPGFEEAWNRDALHQMLAVIPAIELGFVCGIDVHRRQQHSFSGQRHFSTAPYPVIFDAKSAIALMTASLTPGSYSEWPAPSTKRISDSGHTAFSACDVAGGHSKSYRPCTTIPGMQLSFPASANSCPGLMKQSFWK